MQSTVFCGGGKFLPPTTQTSVRFRDFVEKILISLSLDVSPLNLFNKLPNLEAHHFVVWKGLL